MQCSPAEAEFLCRLGPVATTFIKGTYNEAAFVFLEIDLILYEGFARCERFSAFANGEGKISGGDLLSDRQSDPGINCSLQFSDITGPVILEKAIHGFG